ncbi:carboxypeptidase-like regulatory domain-containing protein [Aquimarina sp. 2201CG5-10]|uniref:carboxypeptidase-like regulatory domain-containing protein n=1 Tax=Aquimarina callyspongiae TaxID=3098150 RepID=UPI002AB4B14E|nr:carboxypeptidase-like regulatory domain-containing protein [Aquimarina sp. 2201CG5-10]MDY8136171.1 carboxypeptidase-like regulatory domain-containing protein [Aquimarina sp. 2201CG5-10]
MKKLLPTLLLFLAQFIYGQTYSIKDSVQNSPVSYATISFGNGNGSFADADGQFKFSKKWYPDIDSLYISAIGYKELAVSVNNLSKNIQLLQDVSELKEVLITAERKRKYKTKKRPSTIHDNYFKCWLPTVESEIAVFFTRDPDKSTKIASVYLPVKMENSNRNSTRKQSFSTLFKMQFYSNNKGTPGKRLSYDDIIFNITNKDKSNFELDISEYKVYIPKEGIFVSIQVLGYADKQGKLQQTKKYSEIETRKGIVKVSTTFRPLLPFTDKIKNYLTFTRRIFFKNRTWQRFDNEYSENNTLIQSNHTNYGMGLKLHLYDDD